MYYVLVLINLKTLASKASLQISNLALTQYLLSFAEIILYGYQ